MIRQCLIFTLKHCVNWFLPSCSVISVHWQLACSSKFHVRSYMFMNLGIISLRRGNSAMPNYEWETNIVKNHQITLNAHQMSTSPTIQPADILNGEIFLKLNIRVLQFLAHIKSPHPSSPESNSELLMETFLHFVRELCRIWLHQISCLLWNQNSVLLMEISVILCGI